MGTLIGQALLLLATIVLSWIVREITIAFCLFVGDRKKVS
jgi:hypothetical protein